MKQKQDKRWPEAHIRLKKLYDARVPSGMTQEEFGAEYGLGSQGMVWQYLNGYTPLNYDAAAKFAKGLRCDIRDFSPEMEEAIARSVLPFISRKSWRRAAALVLPVLLSVPLSPSSDARAAQLGAHNAPSAYYVKRRRWADAFSALVKSLKIDVSQTLHSLTCVATSG